MNHRRGTSTHKQPARYPARKMLPLHTAEIVKRLTPTAKMLAKRAVRKRARRWLRWDLRQNPEDT